MGRPRSPDGRRVPVSFKLTEAEAGLVDSLRGETEQSVWLRDAALAAAREQQDSRIRERLGIGITVDDRQPPGVVSVIAPGGEVTEVRSFALASAPKECKHRNLRMAKGVCPDCKTYVAKR